MTKTAQHRGWSSRRLRAANGALALLVVVGQVVAVASARAQTFEVLHSFTDRPDGSEPFSRLIRDKAGRLYGTTYLGGTAGAGTVFGVDETGTETVLYSFTGGADGGFPLAGLVQDTAGNLYGTTRSPMKQFVQEKCPDIALLF